MPVPLPILPASRRFYDSVTIVEIAPGRVVDGVWKPGERSETKIMGSFQAPSPLSQNMSGAGDAGLGTRQLWTRAKLPYYDLESDRQTLVYAEGHYWRITDMQYWGPISHRLYNYSCQRYMWQEADEPPEAEADE